MNVKMRIRHWRGVISAHGGEVVGVSQKKHLKFRLSDGRVLVCGKTPSDHHAEKNQLAQLRRTLGRGLKEPVDGDSKPAKVRRPRTQKAAPEPPQRSGKWIWESHGPQRNIDPAARARLGLDGRATPEAVRFYAPGERPLVSLKQPVK